MKKEEKLDDEKVVEKKESKKKNKPRDRWMVFAVLAITVLISLGFYFVSGKSKTEKVVKPEKGKDFFGSAVYEF